MSSSSSMQLLEYKKDNSTYYQSGLFYVVVVFNQLLLLSVSAAVMSSSKRNILISLLKHYPELALLWLMTFCITLPYLCAQNRDSIYFNLSKEALQDKMIAENDYRVKRGKTVIGDKHYSSQKNTSVDVLITIITVSRNRNQPGGYQPQYLTQTASQIQELIDINHIKGNGLIYGLLVCNVDPDAHSYKEAEWIAKKIPQVIR